MTVKALDATVTIDGNSMASYLKTIKREHQLCHPGQTATIELGQNVNASVLAPWQSAVITEQGSLVMTGVVEEVRVRRDPAEVTLILKDNFKRAEDFFI